jgi:glutathione S-transferase
LPAAKATAARVFMRLAPSLLVARILLFGYVVTRLLHFIAYFTARTHDTRAKLWTPGSVIIIYMAGRTLLAAVLPTL